MSFQGTKEKGSLLQPSSAGILSSIKVPVDEVFGNAALQLIHGTSTKEAPMATEIYHHLEAEHYAHEFDRLPKPSIRFSRTPNAQSSKPMKFESAPDWVNDYFESRKLDMTPETRNQTFVRRSTGRKMMLTRYPEVSLRPIKIEDTPIHRPIPSTPKEFLETPVIEETQITIEAETMDSKDKGDQSIIEKSLREIADDILTGANDPLFENSKFMKFVRQLRDDEIRIQGNDIIPNQSDMVDEPKSGHVSRNTDHFMEYSNSLKNNNEIPFRSDEFLKDQIKEEENSSFDDWTRMYMERVNHLKDDDSWDQIEKRWHRFDAKGLGYIGYSQEIFKVYAFEPANPYLELANPVPEAYALLNRNHLINALLAFEAVAQKYPNSSEAWCQLGLLQSENEKEALAIAAFKKALLIEPKLLSAWMGLAISYMNEIFKHDALNALGSWIKHHPRYSRFLSEATIQMPFNQVDDVIQIFLGIARSTPNEIDIDVQISLGLLFFMKSQYEYAVDCFRAALQKCPRDYRLWNKLGAALVNSNQPADALDAYNNALDINPNYVKARYNLAIACISLDAHEKAIEHLLTAIRIQTLQLDGTSSAGEPFNRTSRDLEPSSSLWSTLRSLCDIVSRPDLMEKCDQRNLHGFVDEYTF